MLIIPLLSMHYTTLPLMDKALFKWCTAVHSEGKSMTGTMIIEKAKSL